MEIYAHTGIQTRVKPISGADESILSLAQVTLVDFLVLACWDQTMDLLLFQEG